MVLEKSPRQLPGPGLLPSLVSEWFRWGQGRGRTLHSSPWVIWDNETWSGIQAVGLGLMLSGCGLPVALYPVPAAGLAGAPTPAGSLMTLSHSLED